jgi:hypothetical protein
MIGENSAECKLRFAEMTTNGRSDKYMNPAKPSCNRVRQNTQNPLRFLPFEE